MHLRQDQRHAGCHKYYANILLCQQILVINHADTTADKISANQQKPAWLEHAILMNNMLETMHIDPFYSE